MIDITRYNVKTIKIERPRLDGSKVIDFDELANCSDVLLLHEEPKHIDLREEIEVAMYYLYHNNVIRRSADAFDWEFRWFISDDDSEEAKAIRSLLNHKDFTITTRYWINPIYNVFYEESDYDDVVNKELYRSRAFIDAITSPNTEAAFKVYKDRPRYEVCADANEASESLEA